MDIAEIFKIVIGTIITVYIAFVLISSFSESSPEFAQYGWLIFGALIIGVIIFFKYTLFNK